MKMPPKDPSKKSTSRKTSDPNRCVFETSDGRRCRLPRSATHASLCVFHSREEQQLLEAQKLGSEIAAPVTRDFLTATDINYVLGKLFTAVAQNRFPARTAHTLAYIAQLMLFSVPAVKEEFNFFYKFDQWNNMLDKAVRLSPPATEPELTSAVLDEAQPQSHPVAPITETEPPPPIVNPTEILTS